jgi:3-deoxy-D-arabino-heptulosonate 7-phosphate (DAHP) synthase class II
MSERAQKIYDAWEEEWLKQKDFYENRSLAAAFKELINQLQVSPGIIMCPDILELCEELENV